MFENIIKFFKKAGKKEVSNSNSKDTAKERLHLVLMQDRANVSADFLDLMRQEIIEVIKKYIDIDESAMDVRLTNQANEDGTQGAPALYANIPIVNIKEKARNAKIESKEKEEKQNEKNEQENEEKKEQENVEISSEEVNKETKEVEEKAKKIVKEENSLQNKDNEGDDLKVDKISKNTENKKKKESENE